MTVATKEFYLPSPGRIIADVLTAILFVAFWLLVAVGLAIVLFAGVVWAALR